MHTVTCSVRSTRSSPTRHRPDRGAPHSLGAPLNTHAFDEALFVVEGELTFQIAETAWVEPPPWALQPIPEITVVGPQITTQS